MSAVITPSILRLAAMNLLAMREHSAKELENKLIQKFGDQAEIHSVIEKIISDNLQSDTRFAEAFIAMRKRQGKGPLLIKMELRERGIAVDLISALVIESEKQWSDLARIVHQKKFSASKALDKKEQLKQMRFLSARGFNSVHIKFAIDDASDFP